MADKDTVELECLLREVLARLDVLEATVALVSKQNVRLCRAAGIPLDLISISGIQAAQATLGAVRASAKKLRFAALDPATHIIQ